MFRRTKFTTSRLVSLASVLSVGLLLAAVFGCNDSSSLIQNIGLPTEKATQAQVERGRALVLGTGCADCHNGGKTDVNSATWLAGSTTAFDIGPFKTYPSNLTPHTTGLSKFTDRQIFNALRFGLDPENTPDATITSSTPGVGGYPATPHYLAPPMPWPAYRQFSDENLWAMVAYIKHGIKTVDNTIPASGAPPDFWASSYTADKIGNLPQPAFPGTNEEFKP